MKWIKIFMSSIVVLFLACGFYFAWRVGDLEGRIKYLEVENAQIKAGVSTLAVTSTDIAKMQDGKILRLEKVLGIITLPAERIWVESTNIGN